MKHLEEEIDTTQVVKLTNIVQYRTICHSERSEESTLLGMRKEEILHFVKYKS